LIAECSLVCMQPCSTPFVGFVSYRCPGSKICYPYHSRPSVLNFDSQFLFL
jgi:hypothetical protein